MPDVASQAPEARFVGGDQAHARFLRGAQEIRHAPILAGRIVENLFDRRCIRANPCGHRVKTIQNFKT